MDYVFALGKASHVGHAYSKVRERHLSCTSISQPTIFPCFWLCLRIIGQETETTSRFIFSFKHDPMVCFYSVARCFFPWLWPGRPNMSLPLSFETPSDRRFLVPLTWTRAANGTSGRNFNWAFWASFLTFLTKECVIITTVHKPCWSLKLCEGPSFPAMSAWQPLSCRGFIILSVCFRKLVSWGMTSMNLGWIYWINREWQME